MNFESTYTDQEKLAQKFQDSVYENAKDAAAELRKAFELALRNPEMEYRVYIDSNGVIGTEEWAAGDNFYFRFRDPDYHRYYLEKISFKSFDILWDDAFSDPEVFHACFYDRFGVAIQDELYPGYSHYEDGLETCIANGISRDDYDEWLDEQREEAIQEECRYYDGYDHLINFC